MWDSKFGDMDVVRGDVLEFLEAFLDEHRRCGELRSDVVDLPGREARVWMECDGYGARLERQV